MHKSHLKWLIPLCIYLIAMTVLLATYRQSAYESAARAKETEITLELLRKMEVINESNIKAEAVVGTTVSAMSLYAMQYNKNQIVHLLKDVVENSDITEVLVCDTEGSGYNHHGEEVSISDKDYFDKLKSEYSKGGQGMIFAGENIEGTDEILMVGGVTFAKRDNGFLVAKHSVNSIVSQVMDSPYLFDRAAVITIDGRVLSQIDVPEQQGRNDKGESFFDKLPGGISKDTIRLNISQNNTYISAVPDYGYAVIVPVSAANAGMVVLITDEQMDKMIEGSMAPVMSLIGNIALFAVLLIVALFLSHFIWNRAEKKSKEKKAAQLETDVLTGVLTRRSAIREVEKYVESEGRKRGMMLVIGLGISEKLRIDKGDAYVNDKIRDFARALQTGFRYTDIIGRITDDEFVVFLKDIFEDKDIRKQTDSVQLLLHDIRDEDMGMELHACAGVALFPDNGRSALEVVQQAEKALSRAREQGGGYLSF